jgi:hypothetical protein
MLDLLSRGWIPTHNIWNEMCLGDGYFEINNWPLMDQYPHPQNTHRA